MYETTRQAPPTLPQYQKSKMLKKSPEVTKNPESKIIKTWP
jgi:hypothetical protein